MRQKLGHRVGPPGQKALITRATPGEVQLVYYIKQSSCLCVCSMFIETETTRVRRLKLGMKVGVGQGRVIGYKVGGSEASGGRWRLF